ncbi:MAG: thiol reductant ABC exporter subunit CydD [Anaerolineales bacterium]|nr:thiol reductant ABC exporter subunit CydD [Anaerolineales bacterium]
MKPSGFDLPSMRTRRPALLGRVQTRRLLQQLKETKLAFSAVVFLILLAGLSLIGQARTLARIIDSVFLKGGSLRAVTPDIITFLALSLLRAVSTWAGEVLAQHTAGVVKQRLRHDALLCLLQSETDPARSEHSGELSAVISDGVEKLDAYYRLYLPQIVQAVLLPLSILLLVFPFDRITGWVLLVTAPLIPFFMVLIGSTASRATEVQWCALQGMSATFVDLIKGITTLKLFGRARAKANQIAGISERFRRTTMDVLKITFLSALVLELLSTLSTALIAVQIGLRLLAARIAFMDALFILFLTPDFFLPLRMLGLRFHAGMAGATAAVALFKILDRRPASAPEGSAIVADPGQKDIRFSKISYTYPGRSRPAVSDLSFSLRSGEMTALIGPTGAGKSTITRLLMGFIQPDTGMVLIGTTALKDMHIQTWRGQIAWVPQRPLLLNDTILENIRFAVPDAPRDEVEHAARLAHAHGFIATLPSGYDTEIGEYGARLSGGQAQRIALARAFLKNAPVLILDEPAAQLDLETETLFLDSLRRLRTHRTVLVIAHRARTIREASQVIILKDGFVVQQGPAAQVLPEIRAAGVS